MSGLSKSVVTSPLDQDEQEMTVTAISLCGKWIPGSPAH